MDCKNLYSIRMRASIGDRHVSGGERIVIREKIERTVEELVERAMRKGCTRDQVNVTLEPLRDAVIHYLTALDVITLSALDVQAGRNSASRVLLRAGVSAQAVHTAISHLSSGAALSGGNMRGAMIIDAQRGDRLETDSERGVRASRFDWSEETGEEIFRQLAALGLTHFRTREALALATKVAYAPGIVAELCWSDDPDYTAGYVASVGMGYVRFPILKKLGDAKGGRAFFVDKNALDMGTFLRYLEQEAALITDIGECRAAMEPEAYFNLKNIRPSR
jgi:6-carboxyhexanoate--CoA ligase